MMEATQMLWPIAITWSQAGCPIELVYQQGAGSALLGRLGRFKTIVQGMVCADLMLCIITSHVQYHEQIIVILDTLQSSVLDVPLTVKTRISIYDKSPMVHKIIPKLIEWGASAITVWHWAHRMTSYHITSPPPLFQLHGRSREQRYSRLADWDYISKCAKIAAPVTLIGMYVCWRFIKYQTMLKLRHISWIKRDVKWSMRLVLMLFIIRLSGNGDVYSFTDVLAHREAGLLSSFAAWIASVSASTVYSEYDQC